MGTISKDFSYCEFEKSAVAEKNDICNVITSFDVRDSIKALVDEVLQPLRDAWDFAATAAGAFAMQAAVWAYLLMW